MNLYTAYHPSPLGNLKIQCRENELAAVVFTDGDVGENEEHPILTKTITQLSEFFAGNRQIFDLPMKQTGTAFQIKVWDLLYAIPFGKTISYTQLSKQHGDVKAIRAVAAANGKNNIAIIVPCHRVIGSNRSLTGYAGGLWRKQWLLEHEAKHFSGVQVLDFGSEHLKADTEF